MKAKFKNSILAILMSIFILTSCNTKKSNENSKEKPKEESFITVKDALNREVKVKKDVQSVVLGFNFEEYFAVTGKEGVSKIKGWSRKYWEGRRQSTWDVFVKEFPEIDKIPDVGYVAKNNFSIENVIGIKPDVVFLSAIDQKTLSEGVEKLQKAEIPVIFLDYHTQSLELHEKSTLAIGEVMGKKERAQELVDFYKKQLKKVTDTLDKVKLGKKPRVYVEFSDKSGPNVFGASYGKKMWGALVEQMGGDNIAKDIVKKASEPINPEAILSANPEIIIFAGNSYGNSKANIPLGYTSNEEDAKNGIEAYKKRAGWSGLDAVKNNKVFALYHDLSRHIFDFAGYQFFAKVIQPELFKDLDPIQSIKEFHEKFYPVKFSGTWMIYNN